MKERKKKERVRETLNIVRLFEYLVEAVNPFLSVIATTMMLVRLFLCNKEESFLF